jgi:malonyl-CoA O-methyltransferase
MLLIMPKAESDKGGGLSAGALRRRFERAADTFDDADFVHRHTERGMFERMAPMTVDVRRILDVGSATGTSSRQLARTFRRSRVLSLDLSMNMLRRARRSRSRFARITELRGDALALPLKTGSVDLVFSNLLLPWVDDLPAFFGELARVLRKNGLFVFSTLGPDSFAELRDAWRGVDGDEHVNRFPDMHDVGDAAVRSGLRDPVLDVDWLTLEYRGVDALLGDLTSAGARNSLRRRRRALTGRARMEAVRRALPEPLSVRLELVFGHAWGGGPRPPAGEYRLDVTDIGRMRRRGGGT